jgi:hypothetical protein
MSHRQQTSERKRNSSSSTIPVTLSTMRNVFSHGRVAAILHALREVKWRNWITFLQDHYLSGDKPYWDANKDSGIIGDYRMRLAVPLATDNARVRQLVNNTARHFDNLDNETSFLFRLFWLIWVLPLIGWSLYLAIILDDWGQFLAQVAVWSRNKSLAVARLRYKHTNRGIVFKFYEDRVAGDLPTFVFYTIASRPEYQHLLIDPSSKWIVGGITGLWLLLVSFWGDIWFLGCDLVWRWRLSNVVVTEDSRAEYRDFAEHHKRYHEHTERADVGDGMNEYFSTARKDGDRAVQALLLIALPEDEMPTPRYSRLLKAPLLIITAGLQAQAIYASRNSTIFFAITLGWAIWIIARISYCVLWPHVSGHDISTTFSNIVAGTITLLPLTLAMLFTNNAVLASIKNRVLLAVGLILLVNLLSNLVGTLCKKFAEKLTVGHRSSGAVRTQNA